MPLSPCFRYFLHFFLWIGTLCMLPVSAQSTELKGVVTNNGVGLAGVNIYLPQLNKGATSDKDGKYNIKNIKPGSYLVRVSFLGFKTISDSVSISPSTAITRNFEMTEDLLNLNEMVLTGTRNEIARYNTPVIVNTISNRTFEATQSLSLSEGLSFSPGLRLENNCQNCGFTQLRMNGLDGAYSQILINSRPVFSALAGVYGLEMLPANMVDRIEVIRGGGSVMYGGNAIAGTVNIITKEPINNSFEVGINQSFINLETPDRTLTLNGSLVSKNLDKGITFFGFNRSKQAWDANGDGFSESVKLNNYTFGFDAFWNTSERSKVKLGIYQINEFRRGGNGFDLLPHQTDLTEQLKHNIGNINLSFERYSLDYKHKFSVYTSSQLVHRDSYYGAGGRILAPGDSLNETDILALNAYGNSKDISVVGGFQYLYEMNKKVMFTLGSEYNYNEVTDNMPGYARSINQQVATFGTYAQLEYKPLSRLVILLGGRMDRVVISGNYDLGTEKFPNQKAFTVPVPRFSALYHVRDDLKIRASFAQGYRGPQAFDEDLHIETVGGAARFIRLDVNLRNEKSNSAVVALNYDKSLGKKQFNLVLEGFFTQLINPFILSGQQELPSGVAVITKRNGTGADVAGLNLEANIAFSSNVILQSGATIQKALYAEAEIIWEPKDAQGFAPATMSNRILRTPNTYGFFTLLYNPNKTIGFSYSGVFTGAMLVPHVVNPETEQTVLKSSKAFFENNIKVVFSKKVKSTYNMQFFAGLQNIFNSYQTDFDLGAQRDAGYVYGPLRPRTFFMGMKVSL